MIEEGKHPARVVDAALAKTGGGSEQVAVGFEITDGPDAGSSITWYGSLSSTVIQSGNRAGGKVYEITFDNLQNCGWDMESFHPESLQTCVGTNVQIVVAHEEYNGNVNARVKFINKPGGLAIKERASADEASALTNKFKANLLKRKQNAPPRQARPQQSAGAPVEDDLPF